MSIFISMLRSVPLSKRNMEVGAITTTDASDVKNCISAGEYLKLSPEISILLYTFCPHSEMLVNSAV